MSLAAVEDWAGVEGQAMEVVRLPGVHHGGFFSVDAAVERVVDEIRRAAGGSIELDRKFSV